MNTVKSSSSGSDYWQVTTTVMVTVTVPVPAPYLDHKKHSFKKNWPVKRLCGRCLSEFIEWRYNWYFRPRFVNWCPSNILFGSTLPPFPTPFPVWISILYTPIQCVMGGIWGSGPQTDKHLPYKVPLHVNFLDDPILRIAFYDPYLSTSVAHATHRVHRIVTSAFWRTFSLEGKISPGWWGWGCTPTPFHYYYHHQ